MVAAIGAAEERPIGVARSSSEAIAAGPEALRGTDHLVVVDDGFGWWPSVNAVELAVAAGVRDVTLVTPGTGFESGIPAESRTQLLPRLRDVRLTIRPLASVVAIGNETVDITSPAGDVERLTAGAVIVVGERRPREWRPLVGGASGLVVGDAIVPRRVAHAIAEGRAAGRAILEADVPQRA